MNDYQERIREFDLFSGADDYREPAFIEKVLGLVGEAGETADKIKKIIRDKDGKISDEDREEIVKELGDTLWYLGMIASYLGVSLQDVADKNISKLASRKERKVLNGEGDNR